jgi:hypothetical protein
MYLLMKNGRSSLLCRLLAICALSAPFLFAEDLFNESCEVPLVVTRYNPSSQNVELVRDLRPDDLNVRVGSVVTAVQRITIDAAPKRLAIVSDASTNIPDEQWELEAEMAASLVERARPDDKFSLFIAGTNELRGSSFSADELKDKLRQFAASRPPSTSRTEPNYDALFAAAKQLDPPEFGDAVFLFGHPEDSGSNKDPDQLLEFMLRNRLRFYGISFSDPLAEAPPFDLNKPIPANVVPLVRTNLAEMSETTGYFFSFHSVRSLSYPGQIQLFQTFLAGLYAGVIEPYRLSFATPHLKGREKLEITITGLQDRGIVERDVHYPNSIYGRFPPPDAVHCGVIPCLSEDGPTRLLINASARNPIFSCFDSHAKACSLPQQ